MGAQRLLDRRVAPGGGTLVRWSMRGGGWEPLRPWGSRARSLSMAPHPPIPRSRTVAGAASRARMCKDGRRICSLESMCRRIGWTFASGRAGRSSPSRATTKAWSILSSACARFRPALIALEATGGYETVVASALAAAHLPLAVINPRQIRDFARSTGKLAKTDRLDAAAHSPSKRRASFDALSLTSPRPSARPRGLWPTAKPWRSVNWWRAGGRSSR